MPTILTKEGISNVTIINTDDAGNVSENTIKVKIDKQKPNKPEIELSGEKIIQEGIWYTNDVTVKMTGADFSEQSGVKEIEYQLKDKTTNSITEGKLGNGESFTIVKEGSYDLTAYTIDIAGNKSEQTTVEIYIDETDPVAGTMELRANGKDGEEYTSDTWTNQNVYAELKEGNDEISGHASTTYQITGTVERNDLVDSVILTKQGEYTITVTTKDVSGRSSTREYQIKIDKQIPDSPTIEITSGTKENEKNEWYNSDVTLKITQGLNDEGGSGLDKTTYEITGSNQIQETEIITPGTISIVQDGIYEITAYTYDVAGNRSEGTTYILKMDKTAPQDIKLQTENVTGTSFTIAASAKEDKSGIVLYQFYVDGELYKEIETNEINVQCEVIEQNSSTHEFYVKIKDLAGNISTSETMQVNMGKLSISDIDYIEFNISDFKQTKDDVIVNSGADFVVSDTSISDATKFIQVTSSDSETTGEILGDIKIVRKDGSVAQLLEYYPEDMIIGIAQYSDGSGTTWTHEANVNVLNTTLSNADIEEGGTMNTDVTLLDKQNSDNVFSIKDKKITGTKTYTRLIIRHITLNGEKIPFKITSNVI